jgi:hypothetical protein
VTDPLDADARYRHPAPFAPSPEAALVPVKSVRAWARTGRISRRLKNRDSDPKQKKYLVNLNEVVAMSEQLASASTSPPSPNIGPVEGSNFHERASEILAARAARER